MATLASFIAVNTMTFSLLERFQGMVLGMAIGECLSSSLASSPPPSSSPDACPRTTAFLQLALAPDRVVPDHCPVFRQTGLPIAGVLLGAIEFAGPPQAIALELDRLGQFPPPSLERTLLLALGRGIALQVRDQLSPPQWPTLLAPEGDTPANLEVGQALLTLLENRAGLTEIAQAIAVVCPDRATLELAIALVCWFSHPDGFSVCLRRVQRVAPSPLALVLTGALAGMSATPQRIPLALQRWLLAPSDPSSQPRTQLLQATHDWWQRWSGIDSWQESGGSPLAERAVTTLPWLRSS